MKKKTLLTLEKLQNLQELESKPLEGWLKEKKYLVIKLYPNIENLIENIFLQCQENILKLKSDKKLICYILEYPLKSNWTIFIDKLNLLNDQNILVILLFKTLAQELISKEKAFKPFWTTAFKELSEKLSSPTKTGLVDSDSISLKALSLKQVEKLPSLTKKQTLFQKSKNFLKTSYLSSASSIVDKWEEENIKNPVKYKTLNVKLKLTPEQKIKVKQYEECFREVHNITLSKILYDGHRPNFYDLRNTLVSKKTKLNSPQSIEFKNNIKQKNLEIKAVKEQMKLEKNNIELKNKINKLQELINEEKQRAKIILKNVPYQENTNISDSHKNYNKDLRASAVKKVCDSYKTCISNLRNNNITKFNVNFMRKNNFKKSFEITSSQISLKHGSLRIPGFGNGISVLKTSNRTREKLKKLQKIEHNCDICFYKNQYWLKIPVKVTTSIDKETFNVCGVDPGIHKIATVCNEKTITEYRHNRELLKRLNDKLQFLKSTRKLKNKRKRVRKKQINKIEKKKIDYTDRLHWSFIKELLDNNDVVFFGDIKSHDIVSKEYKNSNINQEFNDLKFFKLKTRLIYKAKMRGKMVFLTPEPYTSQTCSCCGNLKKIGSSRIFNCEVCKTIMDRDNNSSKNILMKSILC